MKKINLSILIGMVAFISCQKEQSMPDATLVSQSVNDIKATYLPTTAASFPKEVIPYDGGRIEFWGKVLGFKGSIPGPGEATFYYASDDNTGYYLSFSSNNGHGGGGLCGMGGYGMAATNYFGNWTYESIIKNGSIEDWHHYVVIWNIKGLHCFDNKRQVAVYIDNKLNSKNYYNGGDFPPLTGGRLVLLTSYINSNDLNRQMVMDELKIYDKHNNLVLWNTMGSKEEIEHSKIGLNGSFDGFGNAHFIPGKSGYALIANPVKAE